MLLHHVYVELWTPPVDLSFHHLDTLLVQNYCFARSSIGPKQYGAAFEMQIFVVQWLQSLKLEDIHACQV